MFARARPVWMELTITTDMPIRARLSTPLLSARIFRALLYCKWPILVAQVDRSPASLRLGQPFDGIADGRNAARVDDSRNLFLCASGL